MRKKVRSTPSRRALDTRYDSRCINDLSCFSLLYSNCIRTRAVSFVSCSFLHGKGRGLRNSWRSQMNRRWRGELTDRAGLILISSLNQDEAADVLSPRVDFMVLRMWKKFESLFLGGKEKKVFTIFIEVTLSIIFLRVFPSIISDRIIFKSSRSMLTQPSTQILK